MSSSYLHITLIRFDFYFRFSNFKMKKMLILSSSTDLALTAASWPVWFSREAGLFPQVPSQPIISQYSLLS